VIIGAGASYYSVNYKTTPRVPEQQSTENKAIVVPNAAAQGSPNNQLWTKNFQTAVTAFDKEQYPAAEKLLQRSILEARHSQNKSELLLALHKLEDVLYVQKKFKEADLLDQELHRTAASATVAPAKESQDDRIAHLALACHKNGQCDTAISLLQHSIEISKRMYGAHSLKTAERLSELAMVYMALDQPDDAQPLLNEVMEIKASQKGTSAAEKK
jgi:tetratricopeptide (TPR) repeat protein